MHKPLRKLYLGALIVIKVWILVDYIFIEVHDLPRYLQTTPLRNRALVN